MTTAPASELGATASATLRRLTSTKRKFIAVLALGALAATGCSSATPSKSVHTNWRQLDAAMAREGRCLDAVAPGDAAGVDACVEAYKATSQSDPVTTTTTAPEAPYRDRIEGLNPLPSDGPEVAAEFDRATEACEVAYIDRKGDRPTRHDLSIRGVSCAYDWRT